MGLMAAWRLAQAEAEVTLYEAHTIGSGASGASLGGLVPYPWHKQHDLANAQRHSLTLWSEISRDLGDTIGYAQGGRLQILPSAEARITAEQDTADSKNPQQLVEEKDLFRYCNAVKNAPHGAVWCPTTAWVDPTRTLQALTDACRYLGVKIHEHHPVTTTDDITADQIILTTGIGTPALDDTKLVPVLGEAIQARLPKQLLNCMVRQQEIYVIPKPDNRIHIGSTSVKNPAHPLPDAARCMALWARGCALIPGLKEAEIEYIWAGVRPLKPPPNQLIERLDSCTIRATGHYKIGFCVAPMVAEKIVHAVFG